METSNVVLTFKSVDEILWCNYLNETFSGMVPFVFQYFTMGFFSNFNLWH